MSNASATAGSRATNLELRDVTKRYANSAPGAKAAVEHLSLTVPAGEICVLVGPSGCGKTTAMRLVNRMIEMTSGDILLDGHTVNDRHPADLRREIGYVIQQVGLFPHLDVADNIATVPKLLGWDKHRIAGRVTEMMELVGLEAEMAKRLPSQLSGGQRQRVGVARALAADPPLMLMDEPFGAIDPINRERLQDEFLRLQSEIKKTVVFVTHDIDEAIKMGDKIAIMRVGGELVQYDSPNAILANPADEFVARFVGADRGLKRLALTKLADIQLLKATTVRRGEAPGATVDGMAPARAAESGTTPARAAESGTTPARAAESGTTVVVDDDGRPVVDGAAQVQIVSSEFTLREALSLMMTDSLRPVLVTDGDGRVSGFVSIELINQSLHQSAHEPRPAVAAEG